MLILFTMDDIRTTRPLPQWLQGTHEEHAGVAGTAGCWAALITFWLTAMVIGGNLGLAVLLSFIALFGTFHIISTRLIDGRWLTLGDAVDSIRWLLTSASAGSIRVIRMVRWRDRPIILPAAGVAGIAIVFLFLTRSPESMRRDYKPGTYFLERRKELDAKDVWANRSEQKDGLTRTLVLILLKDGKVVEDILETESKREGSIIRPVRETLVWSTTAASEHDIVNFPVDRDGTSLFGR